MFRCPLPSCHHQVLNNVFIEESLYQHCTNNHNNELTHYIFYYKINNKWKTFLFPQLPVHNNPHKHDPSTNQNENKNIFTKNNYQQEISPEKTPFLKKLNQTVSQKKESSENDTFLSYSQLPLPKFEQIFKPPPGLT